MVQLVALLKRNVSAPVADLDVAVELGNVRDGLHELESDTSGQNGTSWLLAKGTIGELGTLLDGELLVVAASRDLGIVRDGGRSSLDLGLLL